ncbi:Pantothenate kinase type III, CoaX-like [Candidatus Sumerlaea chitinivorans]|uniref:Type III pantothenate kinase n=1 Tax=Sumerlaea chitinivorans TaxID=2250252 RepID=A0A2Z4Y424_SUMC1|nr:Pantothenate kinase type III, CoaX-like [Candidatus Sumerlaea chitinivorans]
MLLTVDIGNTNIALGLFDGDSCVRFWRAASDTRRTVDEYAVLLEALLAHSAVDVQCIEGVVIGSVVPVLSDTLNDALQRVFGRVPFHVTYTVPMPVKNRYAKPNEVGVDRLANAVAGVELVGAPTIIVDVGTAITLDVVNKRKEYLGGAILPGLEMSAEALAKRTARLPRVAPHEPHHVIGRTTVESIRSGLLNGLVGSVDYLIERMWEELGYRTAVIATGGLAGLVTHRSRLVKESREDLTLLGLKRIFEFNHTKKILKARRTARNTGRA